MTATTSPIITYFRVLDGVRVRYADSTAASGPSVLLLAPWPESLWAFFASGIAPPASDAQSPSTCHGSASPTVALSRACDRQLNSGLHRVAVTQVRMRHSIDSRYADTKLAEG